MSTKRLLTVFTLVSLSLIATSAFATTYYETFCFEYETNFLDAPVGDYFTTNSNQPAFGVLYRITRNNDNVKVKEAWASASTGCTSGIGLDSTKQYTIELFSKAMLDNNNQLKIKQTIANDRLHGITLSNNWAPSRNGTFYLTWNRQTGGSHPNVSNLMAAFSYAVKNNSMGLSNTTFRVYTYEGLGADCISEDGDPCDPFAGISIWHTNDDGTKVASKGPQKKFLMMHEFGHAIAMQLDNNRGKGVATGNPYGKCADSGNGHHLNSQEYQGAAFWEGFAHFYAMSVWNKNWQNDCAFAYYDKADLDIRDGADDPYNNYTLYDCKNGYRLRTRSGGTTVQDNFTRRGCDCFNTVGNYYDPNNCDRPIYGTGNEMDWGKFFWDLNTDGGVSLEEIGDIIEEVGAYDYNWNKNDLREHWGVYGAFQDAAGVVLDDTQFVAWTSYASLNGINI